IDPVAFRLFVRRLAPYGLFRSGHKSEAVRRQLVLVAAHENQGRLSSCVGCQDFCQDRWGVELERDEISVATRQLIEDGKLIQEPEFLRLTESCSEELAERIRVSNEVEATALSEWEGYVGRTAPSLGYGQVAALREDLIAWVQQIIVECGVEAAVVLYPEEERFRHRLDEIKALGFGFLPRRDATVMLARPEALKGFFEYMTPMQRRYFDSLMTTAYLMSAFTLDPAALDEVQKLTNGQRLYLDTNIVYPLLKLHGARGYAKIRRVLILSRVLGYQTCVTPWTLAEMQESVRAARLRLARQPSPQALTDVSAHAGESDNDEVLIRAFGRMERSTGIKIKDFFDLHEQVESLLEIEGVEVVSDGCHAIDHEAGRYDEEIAALERVRQGPEKSRLLQEHDVKLRLLIERLRGDEERRLSNVGYLVLTDDHTMIRYAASKQRNEVPFALSLNDWADYVRSMSPRTQDYAKSMEEILDTPSMRTTGLVSQEEVVDAIARINLQEKYSPAIGARLLIDTSLSDGGEDMSPDSYGPSASEREVMLTARALALEGQLAAERRTLAARDAELASAREAYAGAERRIQRALAQAPHVQEPDKADISVVDKSSSEEIEELKTRVSRHESILRWLVASIIFVIGAATLVVPVSFGWIAEGWPLAADICGSAAIMIGAVAWRYGTKLASALLTGCGLCLSVIVAVHAFTT
ncbi:MAG TPA: hypothetical protein VGL37_09285, partial [Solirubrobacteraceae bacterium]